MLFDAHFIRGLSTSRLAGRNWLVALAFCAMLSGTAAGQYRFDSWTTDNGLPQNSVLGIAQTPDGYLWLTTFNGLVRFDGVRFTVFNKNNTKALPTSRFSDLFLDATGALWLGTSENGVIRYQNNQFTTFTSKDGLLNNSIRQIQGRHPGEVLISMGPGSVWWRNGQFIPDAETASESDLKDHLGQSGIRWSLDKNGLHGRLADQVTHYSLPVEPTSASASMLDHRIHEDRHGAVWVSLWRRGVFRLKDGKIVDYTKRLKLAQDLSIWQFFEDKDGALWFGTASAGLIHFKDEPGAEPVLYTTANGLSSNAIRSIFQDREGTLWVGTGGGGLNRLTPQFISGYSTANGLGGNITHAVLADRAGNVWVCTQVGLSKISGGGITNYTAADGLPLQGLQALHEDRAGRLWIGSSFGLCYFKDGVFSPVIPNLNVWAILEDSRGNIWVGTHYGLLKFKDGVKTVYTVKDGLPNDTVRAIYEDRQGTLWLGTEGGLVKYREDRFTVFTSKDGLVNDRVWSIYEDAEGAFWLGTFDGGLSRFKNGRFTSYTTAQGLYDNGVFQILEDGRGNLWMSCFRGLYSVSKQQLNDFADGKIRTIACAAYGKAAGMLNRDCNGGRQPSGIKTPDGRLWFTTLTGVAVVNTEAVTFNPLPPPVLIEGASIDRAEASIAGGLRVAPGQNNLEISYTALSFINPEQVWFRYRLVGQDQDWVEARSRRTANYSYLPPGEYTFKVIAANSDGVWNEAGAALRVVVVPPFYLTWWFRGLVLLCLAGGILLIYRLRVAQLQKEYAAREAFSRQLLESREVYARQLLESQEAERKRIAAELHDGLGQNLLIIKNHALLGLVESDDAAAMEESLTTISSLSSQVLDEARQIAYNLRPFQIDRLGLTKALQSMLGRVADASEISFQYEVDNLDNLFPKEAEMNLYRIVQESLNNILKHSRATEAEVRITRDDQQMLVRIADNGQGFTPDADAETARRGLGLTSLAERARMLGGQYQIHSAPGKGTLITITIAFPETARQ